MKRKKSVPRPELLLDGTVPAKLSLRGVGKVLFTKMSCKDFVVSKIP